MGEGGGRAWKEAGWEEGREGEAGDGRREKRKAEMADGREEDRNERGKRGERRGGSPLRGSYATSSPQGGQNGDTQP